MLPDTFWNEGEFVELRGGIFGEKFGAEAVLREGVIAYARPVFATLRNTGENSCTSRTYLAVDHFQRLPWFYSGTGEFQIIL